MAEYVYDRIGTRPNVLCAEKAIDFIDSYVPQM